MNPVESRSLGIPLIICALILGASYIVAHRWNEKRFSIVSVGSGAVAIMDNKSGALTFYAPQDGKIIRITERGIVNEFGDAPAKP